MLNNLPLVVFSHLRWDFVYQRPQHLLSRFARDRQVFFIEEPVQDFENAPHLELSQPAANVVVARPHTPRHDWSFTSEQIAYIQPLVADFIEQQELTDYVVWLYTPMALPLAQTLQPRAVVFDVMDELSAFVGAPQEMKDLEATTLAWADVVFTGGPSLYRAKLGRHDNLHCFPSSVDAAHFAQARSMVEAQNQANLPHPRLGFYGVIDERMDLPLLDFLASSHPEWQIVMVGPVVKIDWNWLPKRPNLHFLGQRQYSQLPEYLAGWDVCLLPFALNESTRFISPTKTLEYMAAELPIVSTPITDVAEPYGHIVYIGGTKEEFVAACEQAMSASTEERARRVQQMREILAHTSWDNTVAAMSRLIDEAVKQKNPLSSGEPTGGSLPSSIVSVAT
ncbi:MAG: UDP-galactopyranose mutase [Chloroflexia bacterium]|jgi:UDP-galactopyranose mutase|nr:UDP-galactopyranose mutase [Chloroflexia bacterium]